MAGYSNKPLAQKLGIRRATRLLPVNPPDGYADLLGPLPDGARLETDLSAETDIVHLFTARRADLEERLTKLRREMADSAMIWVSWPRWTAELPTDLTEDTIRDVALPLGFVDVKVCAVTGTWSGLKLVVRKELRGKPAAV